MSENDDILLSFMLENQFLIDPRHNTEFSPHEISAKNERAAFVFKTRSFAKSPPQTTTKKELLLIHHK